MADREYRLHNGKRGAALAIRVTPRARKNEIAEVLHDGTVRIRLTAAPAEGLTNTALAEHVPPRNQIAARRTSGDFTVLRDGRQTGKRI